MSQYPKEWTSTSITDIAFVKGGKRLPKGDKFSDVPTSFPYIRVTDFKNFSVRLSDIKYLRPATRERIKRYTISANDVYISIAGTIGLTGKIPHELEGANLTENAAKIVIKSDKVDASFVMFYLSSDLAQREVESQTVKNAQPKLALTRIESLNISLPPPDEQRRIAHVLTNIQNAIAQQERLIALTSELKRALMHKLFTKGLSGEKQKQTKIGLLPESWEIKPFDEFTTLQRGKDLTKSEFKQGEVPVAGSNGVIGFHNESFVKAPGATVGRSGSVGKVIYYEVDFWAHNTSLYVKDFHGNDKRFAAYYLDFLNLSRFGTGASVPTLDRNSFRQIPVAVPMKDEQITIAQVLATIDKKIELLSMKKRKFGELFHTLLHQLMTAQIRVNDLEL